MSTTIIEHFTAGQAARLARVPYRTLDYWARSGFLVPSVQVAAGRGTDRLYSFGDVIALRVASDLRSQGISLQALRKVVAWLRARGYEGGLAEAGPYLVCDGQDVYERKGDELLSAMRRPGHVAFAFVLDLQHLVEEVRAAAQAA